MSKPKNDSAFPLDGENAYRAMQQGNTGMTMRDYFAARAMEALINNEKENNVQTVAWSAYRMADAMLEQREKDSEL